MKELTSEQLFLDTLFQKNSSNKYYCTKSSLDNYIKKIHRDSNLVVPYEETMAVAMYEAVLLTERFEATKEEYKEMAENLNSKKTNQFIWTPQVI